MWPKLYTRVFHIHNVYTKFIHCLFDFNFEPLQNYMYFQVLIKENAARFNIFVNRQLFTPVFVTEILA